jgi:hypothetical protein
MHRTTQRHGPACEGDAGMEATLPAPVATSAAQPRRHSSRNQSSARRLANASMRVETAGADNARGGATAGVGAYLVGDPAQARRGPRAGDATRR